MILRKERDADSKDVIEAFDICFINGGGCYNCPYQKKYNYGVCAGKLKLDVRSLLAKQAGEIERLKAKLSNLQ